VGVILSSLLLLLLNAELIVVEINSYWYDENETFLKFPPISFQKLTRERKLKDEFSIPWAISPRRFRHSMVCIHTPATSITSPHNVYSTLTCLQVRIPRGR
jgi:hypothetical protein